MKAKKPKKPRRRIFVNLVPGMEDDLKAIHALLNEAREGAPPHNIIANALELFRWDLEDMRENKRGLFDPERLKAKRSRKVPPWDPPVTLGPPSDKPHVGVLESYRQTWKAHS